MSYRMVASLMCSAIRATHPGSATALCRNAPAPVPGADRSTPTRKQVMLPQQQSDAPQTWDELASKLERRFGALGAKLDVMRKKLDDAQRHGRQLEDTLLRKGCLHG